MQQSRRSKKPKTKPPYVEILEKFPKKTGPQSSHQVSELLQELERYQRDPCPAARRIRELHDKLFKLMAEMIISGILGQASLTWLDCDKCRAKLHALVEEGREKIL